jgi:hypothetical protein
VLHGSDPRGTWLISDRQYADFRLEFEWKLGERGNGGCGIRFPAEGDPAFDGIEIQMVDVRYNDGRDGPEKLTGSLYNAVAPKSQVYRPTDWNRMAVTCVGPALRVELNGEVVQDVNLDDLASPVKRHDDSQALPLKERPRVGYLGFQELSRGGGRVMIRNARVQELP